MRWMPDGRFRPACLAAIFMAALAGTTAARAADWPQFGRTPAHTNSSPAETAFTPANVASLRIAWKGHFGDNVATEGGTAIAGSRVYATGFDGRLSVFDLAGCGAGSCEPQWQGATRNDITSTPAVADGVVFVASADHFLHAFAADGCGAASCPPLWRGRLQDGSIDSSVTVAGGIAFVGDHGGRLYAFAAAGCGLPVCAPLWTAQAGPNEQLVSTAAIGEGHVYIATTFSTPDDVSGRLLAFSLAECGVRQSTCEPEWTADLGGPAGRTAAPLVARGKVYAGSSRRFGGPNGDDHLFAFAAAGCGAPVCAPQQVFDVGPDGIDAAPALSGNRLFASTNTSPRPNSVGVVAAFDLATCGARCKPAWTGINFTEGFISPPVVAGDVVFVGKGPASLVDAGVFAFDARGCGRRTCDPLGLVLASETAFYVGAPLAIADGRIGFVSNDNGDGHSNVVILSLP